MQWVYKEEKLFKMISDLQPSSISNNKNKMCNRNLPKYPTTNPK